jgi:hypothetical protein
MRRRTQHEMDEWPELRKPWHSKFWNVFLIWGIIVVGIIVLGSAWRVFDFSTAKSENCHGVVKQILPDVRGTASVNNTLIRARLLVNGREVDVMVDRKQYPDLQVGDTVDLVCRKGKTGLLFIQNQRKVNTHNK